VLVESVIENQIEKRFSRKKSKAIQLVFKGVKIVHVHCKSPNCGNEWKIKDGNDLGQNFDIKENPKVYRRLLAENVEEVISADKNNL